MTIEINDRLYKEFGVWAKANGMDETAMSMYIETAFREKFTLDKYGDLNEKVGNSEPQKKKTTAKTKPSEPVNEQISEQINEQISEQIKDEPPKRKSKVLVSK